MRSASNLDAVTIDAFGTLLELEDPAEPLRLALERAGVVRPLQAVAQAFRTEAAYYRPRSLTGRDRASLEELRTACVGVFLAELGAEIGAESFVPAFVSSIAFRLAEGALPVLDRLRGAGLELACVANWDISLHDHLKTLGVANRFRTVTTSAEAGAEKPDPAIFAAALEALGVTPERALHIGDEAADAAGAERSGLAFEPVPLISLPARIGL